MKKIEGKRYDEDSILTREAQDELRDLHSLIGDAATEIAYYHVKYDDWYDDEKLEAWRDEYDEHNEGDRQWMAESLADHLSCDADFVHDMLADRMWDALREADMDAADPEVWNAACDFVTSRVVTHVDGLNESLKR